MIKITIPVRNPVFLCTVEIAQVQNKWIRIALINLSVVAFLGVVLRYKIAFPLPLVHQKYLLHAHSHFAFTGWVSQALITFLIGSLSLRSSRNVFPGFKALLVGNLVLSYAMLISFLWQGYGFFQSAFPHFLFWLPIFLASRPGRK